MYKRIAGVVVATAVLASGAGLPAQAAVTCPPKLTKSQLTKALGKKWTGGTCDTYALWNMGVGSASFAVRVYTPRKASYTVSVGVSTKVDATLDVWTFFSEETEVLQRTDTSMLLKTSFGTYSGLQLLPSGRYVIVNDAKSQASALKLLSYQAKRLG